MRHTLLLGIVLLAAACASGGREGDGRGGTGGAVMLRGADLNGPLLQAMRGRVTGMTVTDGPAGCPRIIFRGQRSVQRQGDPSVYVDGTLMRDTCILLQIQSSDVDYVQVYTGGASRPAGVEHNPFGTILVQRIRR